MSDQSARAKVTIPVLRRWKAEGKKATWITAYDFPTGQFVDAAGVDMVLVGDSVGNNVLGYPNTIPVTMDQMISHASAVTRGTKYAFVIGDMPFMSYQISAEDAIRNAGRFMKEAGCDAVKLEGGKNMADKVSAIVGAGIPVMGHLGLTPQSEAMMGGLRVQARTADDAKALIDDALALEAAGVFALLVEAIPAQVARLVVEKCRIPVYGIGAGHYTDGQLLIFHDLFGLFQAYQPSFSKRYADVGKIITDGLAQYAREVREGEFPAPEHEFKISRDELSKLKELLG
jgi:3-methyl-2-oxobutanoate hydroxymethyltransferase